MVYLIDSSVWVGAYIQQDPNHEKSKDILKRINGKIIIPYCVINETSTVITYKHSKEQASNFLEALSVSDNVECINNSINDEIAFFKSVSQRISFTDASLLLLTKKHNAKLITLDKQLEKLARKL